jgi:hypothetical protein
MNRRSMPVAVLMFLVCWGAVWSVTVGTWRYDGAGNSIGMGPIAIPLHFVLPLLLGRLAGLRSEGGRVAWMWIGLAGLLFGALHYAVVPMTLRPAFNPLPSGATGFWLDRPEALYMGVVYALLCGGLSLAGAAMGRGSESPSA